MPTSNDDSQVSFVWPIRVYYEDTDAGGVVFYANYLRFMERARTEWLRDLGYEQDVLREETGVIFAVRRVGLEYLAPARFNDRLMVKTCLTRAGGASLEFEQSIERETDATRCCQGVVKVACIAADSLRPSRIPEPLLSAILSATRHRAAAAAE